MKKHVFSIISSTLILIPSINNTATHIGGVLAAMPGTIGAGLHYHHHHHNGNGGGIGTVGIGLVEVEEMDSDNDNDDFAGVPGPGILLYWVISLSDFIIMHSYTIQLSIPWIPTTKIRMS